MSKEARRIEQHLIEKAHETVVTYSLYEKSENKRIFYKRYLTDLQIYKETVVRTFLKPSRSRGIINPQHLIYHSQA